MTASVDRRLPVLVLGLGALAVAFGVLAGVQPQYAVAAAIGLAFTGAVFANLTAGLCVLAVLAYINVGDLAVTKLVGLVLALSWLAMVLTRPHLRAFVADRPALTSTVVLLAGWMIVSVAWAEDTGVATSALTRYFPNLLLLPIVYTAVRTNRHVIWVLATIVGAGGMAALVGLLAPPSDPGLAVGDAMRSTGTVGDANELAAGLVVALALAGAFAFNRRFPTGARLACFGIAALCVLGVFTSLSRGGLIALGTATIAAVLAAGRWRLRAAVVALVLVAGAGVYFTTFMSLPARERIVNVGGGTGRLDLWTVGARMVTEEPLLGVGVGNFPVSSIHYLLRPGAIERAEFIITTPKVAHNTYLQFFAELGILGGMLFIAIVSISLACVIGALRTFRDREDVSMELLTRGALVALIGYLAAIVFISENYSKLMWIMLGLGPALLAVARRPSSSERVASW